MNEKLKITAQPHYLFWCPHLLRALHNLGGSAKFAEIFQEIINLSNVDDSVSEEISGNTEYNVLQRKIHKARGELKNSGYIYNIGYGVLGLNEKAKKEIPNILENLKKLEENSTAGNVEGYIKEVKKFWESRKTSKKQSPTKNEIEPEKLEDALIAKEEKNVQEELNVIRAMNPYSFERLCKEIFKKLDYKDVENTPEQKDGGFDGFGYLAFGVVRLKVAFEAKRYTPPGKVSEKEIKAFESTIRGVNAQNGVFITTSDFTRDAKNFAKKTGSITLIDGKALIGLLRKYEIGYSLVIDKEFFKNF